MGLLKTAILEPKTRPKVLKYSQNHKIVVIENNGDKYCIEAILCHFLLGSKFLPSKTHFGLKNCHSI